MSEYFIGDLKQIFDSVEKTYKSPVALELCADTLCSYMLFGCCVHYSSTSLSATLNYNSNVDLRAGGNKVSLIADTLQQSQLKTSQRLCGPPLEPADRRPVCSSGGKINK